MMYDFIFEVLGLVDIFEINNNEGNKFFEVVELLIEFRNQVRVNKDFVISDQIRD